MATLRFVTYSGMSVPLEEGSNEECRDAAAAYIMRARGKGHEVYLNQRNSHGPMREYEIQTDSNTMGIYVSDEDGYLLLRESPIVEDDEEESWAA